MMGPGPRRLQRLTGGQFSWASRLRIGVTAYCTKVPLGVVERSIENATAGPDFIASIYVADPRGYHGDLALFGPSDGPAQRRTMGSGELVGDG
jgi:hypothetical protein